MIDTVFTHRFFIWIPLFFLTAYSEVQSQSTITGDTLRLYTVTKKAGFYKTFDEFNRNEPSISFSAKVVPVQGYINLTTKKFTLYTLDFGSEEPLEKNTPIWGFCDGTHLFISRLPKFKLKNKYDGVLYINKYIYFQTTESTYNSGGGPTFMAAPGGGAGGMMGGGGGAKPFAEFIIDVNTGKMTELTKESLRELIADDKELLTEFEAEKKKKKVIGEYWIRYEKKHEK